MYHNHILTSSYMKFPLDKYGAFCKLLWQDRVYSLLKELNNVQLVSINYNYIVSGGKCIIGDLDLHLFLMNKSTVIRLKLQTSSFCGFFATPFGHHKTRHIKYKFIASKFQEIKLH